MLQFIGGPQLIILLIVPIAFIIVFTIGFYIGKKSGYIKRIKETENQNK